MDHRGTEWVCTAAAAGSWACRVCVCVPLLSRHFLFVLSFTTVCTVAHPFPDVEQRRRCVLDEQVTCRWCRTVCFDLLSTVAMSLQEPVMQ